MATIEITADTLIVHVHGLDRVLAFRGQLAIPLAHVQSIEFNPEDTQRELDTFLRESYIFGANAPSHTLVGTFTEHDARIFWDVHHPELAVTINLAHDTYAKMIVEVTNPAETAQELQKIVQQHRAATPS